MGYFKQETFHSSIEVIEESLLKGPLHIDLLVLLDSVHLLVSMPSKNNVAILRAAVGRRKHLSKT